MDDSILESDLSIQPSIESEKKSQPKPIHHRVQNNNTINRNENDYNNHGILFGLVRNFFPERHHERQHERHREAHHERHNHFHL